jgi:hypothetical protein
VSKDSALSDISILFFLMLDFDSTSHVQYYTPIAVVILRHNSTGAYFSNTVPRKIEIRAHGEHISTVSGCEETIHYICS